MTKVAKNTQESKTKTDKLRDGFKLWTSFYRANPQRFAKDYLGIQLFLYQKILLWAMNHYGFFMYLAARGQGKWNIACCHRNMTV
ncbi:hypothetical protein [Bacillus sp. S0628]|uniref:hypothetical protein n=1 Tax=Bacillus sp. S0628 TaxID=2957802 RepID=UPI00209D4814|nr:hypothetical protein [Bacillus sp. S0628]MCP1324252.1 hypothetical protein [Bacillus sp. S0628]